MKSLFTTKSGNKYFYSTSNKDFFYIPFSFEGSFSDNRSINESEYYKRKYSFWQEKGIFDEDERQLEIEYGSEYIESNLANLRQLLIEVTDECNLSCKYCGYGKLYENYDIRTGKKQSFKNVKALIDFLCVLWKSKKNISFDNTIYVGFYGGEPLINFNLIKETIDYLESINFSSLRFEYNMTTNGMLLSKHMDYLVNKKFHLLISLDGSRHNNSYRVTKSNKESFDILIDNLKLMKKNYPTYFDLYVNFNAVLHNRNSISSIYEFIKKTFNKNPRIAELSSNGIAQDKIHEFSEMFLSTSDSLKQSLNCEDVIDDLININPDTLLLSNFFDAFTGNTFRTMADLFYSAKNLTYIPTSTCPPFYKKIFLTVNGKILPCEKIGQKISLGKVVNGEVDINFEEINNIYAQLYKSVVDQCKECLLWKNCGSCIFLFNNNSNGKMHCPRFYGKKKMKKYFSDFISYFEEDPNICNQIINEIKID